MPVKGAGGGGADISKRELRMVVPFPWLVLSWSLPEKKGQLQAAGAERFLFLLSFPHFKLIISISPHLL